MLENIAGQLQQRIGEITSRFEVEIAVLKATAARQAAEKDKEIARLTEMVEAQAEEK